VIVVTGASGQLGTALRKLLGDRAVYLERRRFDISKVTEAPERHLDRYQPDLIINCAAYTAVDRAEAEPATAFAVNALAVKRLAEYARSSGARLVTFSTDHVFNGASRVPYVESDPPDPINVYGRTKRDGEVMALAANPKSLIVRTSWLISGTHANFARSIIRATERNTVSVVDDQHGRPTIADDLARVVVDAAERGADGLLHLTNQGTMSRYELAREIVGLAGRDPDLVRPCSSAEYPSAARRPRNGALSSERLAALGLAPLPAYANGLVAAVREMVGSADDGS
jgi:dTDP-4-dehydrorhamnose reductase